MSRTSRDPSLWIALALSIALSACGKGSPREEASPPAGETAAVPRAAAGRPAGVPVDSSTGADSRLSDPDFLKTQPPSAQVDIAIGNAYLGRGDLDSALVYYRSATDRDPQSPAAWNFLGICLGRMDRLDAAEKAYGRAIELDALYTKTHVNLGNVYFRKNELDKAIAAYEVATSIDSTNGTAWLNLGLAHEKKQEENPAIYAYTKASRCNPDDPEPWERLGWIYYDRGLYAAARDRWMKAVNRDSSRTDLKDNIQRLLDYAESTGTQ